MRLRNFKRGFYNALEKAEKNKKENQILLVMLNEKESEEIFEFLISENISFQKFPDEIVPKDTIKFTFIDKDKPTIGFIKKEEPKVMKNLVDV